MKIDDSEKDLIKFIEAKPAKFDDLAAHLFTAIALFKVFPKQISEFPPSPGGIEAMKKITKDFLNSKKVEDARLSQNIDSEQEDFENMVKFAKSFFRNWKHCLSQIDVTDIDSCIKLIDYCATVGFIYRSISTVKEDLGPLGLPGEIFLLKANRGYGEERNVNANVSIDVDKIYEKALRITQKDEPILRDCAAKKMEQIELLEDQSNQDVSG